LTQTKPGAPQPIIDHGQGASPGESTSQRDSLAVVVDITCSTPHYDAALSKALAPFSEVTFRTSPYFLDRSAFHDSFLRRDLLKTTTQLADRFPSLARRQWLWKALQLQGYVSAWGDILREMRQKGTSILHIQWCKIPFFDIWQMRRAQKQGVRIVYTVHNALPHLDRRRSVRQAYRKLYRQADALVVLSRVVGQQVIDWVDDSVADKIHVIEHGILELSCAMPNREHARSELNLRDDEDVVLFMGAINPYKGITDLIEAVSIARRDRPRLRLIIAGSPQDSFEPYRAQIQRLDLTEMVLAYPEYVSEKFKATLYAAADATVLPHRDASQSAMGLEALAAGKPLIVTQGGGLVELVEEEINGYSVPVRDPVALANALSRFFAQPRSAQEAMAEASRALGRERFAWQTIAKKHMDLYRQLAEEVHPTPAKIEIPLEM
jgi:glycosyltransferase involved in cell wall biosynthesis